MVGVTDEGDGGSGGTDAQTSTAVFDVPLPAQAAVRPCYLLVIEGNTARLVQLPVDGDAYVGRAGDAAVKLDDAAVSRHHALIRVERGRARLRDLDSHNGTRVDGVRIAGEVGLRPGAVIGVCSTQMIFHGGAPLRQQVCDVDGLRVRIDDEAERAVAQDRSFAVVAVRAISAAGLVDAMVDHLRGFDRLAASGDEVLVFLPEVDGGEAAETARRLVTAATGRWPEAHGGYAVHPGDGDDADSLIAAARAAAAAAAAGEVAATAAGVRTVEVGARRVILADEAMRRLYELLERIAAVDLPVLILGETGTGKELAAAALHRMSGRRDGPLVAFNCAALPDTLAESELFGHERGAFTGAAADKVGLLESAAGGTVFLDEVADLSPGVQAKLLRVLEAHRFNRIGSAAERAIDVRVVAATNRDLPAEVDAGRFRRDLYFRLGAATLWLPPLRDRRGEIAVMAHAFLDDARRATGRAAASLSEQALRRLTDHDWPGNVRELRNCVEFLAATVAGDVIDAVAVERYLAQRAPRAPSDRALAAAQPEPTRRFRPIKEEVRELERTRMVEALRAAHGNQTLAAALIEMPLRTFVAKLKQYAIDPRATR